MLKVVNAKSTSGNRSAYRAPDNKGAQYFLSWDYHAFLSKLTCLPFSSRIKFDNHPESIQFFFFFILILMSFLPSKLEHNLDVCIYKHKNFGFLMYLIIQVPHQIKVCIFLYSPPVSAIKLYQIFRN